MFKITFISYKNKISALHKSREDIICSINILNTEIKKIEADITYPNIMPLALVFEPLSSLRKFKVALNYLYPLTDVISEELTRLENLELDIPLINLN